MFAITGQFENWQSGSASVSFLIDRMLIKESVAQPATLEQEGARRAAYFDRFNKANDKSAAQAEVEVRDGRIELALTVAESLAGKVRWLQVYVRTEPTQDGKWLDGVAAQEVKLVAEEKK